MDPEARLDVRVTLILSLLALTLYLPGITWGLPSADAPGMTWSWADDEIGPLGPLVELHNTFVGPALGNPQYPLFHYILVAAFCAPYLLLQLLAGGLVHPQPGYPYGFTDPVTSVQTLLLIGRGVSVLMGMGTVVVAYLTTKYGTAPLVCLPCVLIAAKN